MRAEVKLGIGVALAIGLAGGSYFMFRGSGEEPIPVANVPATSAQPANRPASGKPGATPATNPRATPSRPAHPGEPAKRPVSSPGHPASTASPSTPTTSMPGGRPNGAPSSSLPTTSRPTGDPTTSSSTTPSNSATGPVKPEGSPPTGSATPTTGVPSGTASPAEKNERNEMTPDVPGAGSSAAPRQNSQRPTSLIVPPTGPAIGSSPQPTPASSSSTTSTPGQPARDVAGPSTAAAQPNLTPPTGVPSTATQPGSQGARPAPGMPPDRNLTAGASPPTRTAAPAGLPAQPATPGSAEKHRVQPGDTFTSLSENYYGTPRFAQFLIDSNPEIRDPRRLSVGAVLKIPEKPGDADIASASRRNSKGDIVETNKTSTDKPAADNANGRRTYTVKEGDSFYSIAKSQLGGGGRWKQLYALNKQAVDGDPRNLRPGQVLTLPEPGTTE